MSKRAAGDEQDAYRKHAQHLNAHGCTNGWWEIWASILLSLKVVPISVLKSKKALIGKWELLLRRVG